MKAWKIPQIDHDLRSQLQAVLDAKTKPLGSLGNLEELAVRIGLIQNTLQPRIARPCMIVFAGDHGIARERVSPYPQSVTAAMVRNFVAGGAAINVLTRQLGWQLKLVNSGTIDHCENAAVLDRRLGSGTESFLDGPAMNVATYRTALQKGAEIARETYQEGSRLMAFGEMGIGNSAAAAMVIHYLADRPLTDVVSRGAGCDDEQLLKKIAVLEAARQKHGQLSDPDEVMARFAGFEMAMIAGALLEAASLRVPILVDGLIVSSVALAAVKARPELLPYLIFAHRSSALGHDAILEYLGVKPLLDLGMRLGEGSGAALALPLLQAAVNIFYEMATFVSAEVAQRNER